MTNNTTRVDGYATETDDRRINPPPPGESACVPAKIDKSGRGKRGFDHAEFGLDSATSQDRPPLHMTMDLGGMLNALAQAGDCYNGLVLDFRDFPGNSQSDSDTGVRGQTYGALVGPRLTMAMFTRRQAFTVTASDTHRSVYSSRNTGRRFVRLTFTPLSSSRHPGIGFCMPRPQPSIM